LEGIEHQMLSVFGAAFLQTVQ